MPRTPSISVTLFQSPDRPIIFSQLPYDDFPIIDYHFEWLFKLLSLPTILKLFSALLTERKIVICTKHVALLCPVAETLKALLFPFKWQYICILFCLNYFHLDIPVLPIQITGIFQSPTPFLVGMHTHNIERDLFIQPDIFIFDLDQDFCRHSLTTQQLPEIPRFYYYFVVFIV